jgi:hypothetical protein
VDAATALKAASYSAPALLTINGPLGTAAAALHDRDGLGQCVGKPIIDDAEISHPRQLDKGRDTKRFSV